MSDRFTPAYIDLCRKLALPRVFEYGDFYLIARTDGATRVSVKAARPGEGTGNVAADPPHLFWLPTEGDWLDLLEAKGYQVTLTVFHDRTIGHLLAMRPPAITGPTDNLVLSKSVGSDRLMTLGSLYAAVKGIDLA